MKFDYIIGNPPYQDETLGDNATYAPPIYHLFLDEAYKIADRVELIHPARFLFDAGTTPKQWNRKMLEDPHLAVLLYEEDSRKIFANKDIKGGVAITYHDNQMEFGSIEIFTKYAELNTIIKKVKHANDFKTFSQIVFSRTAYRLTDVFHEDYPNAISELSEGHPYDMSTNIFDRLPFAFSNSVDSSIKDDYIVILGRESNTRVYKFIKRKYVNSVANLDFYKIFLPSANGNGAFGECLSAPLIAAPGFGATETFVGIGCFEIEQEAKNALSYISTRFVRALLSILKVTQHITPEKWKYVPLQDFTVNSDIDWSQPVAGIDRQLYAKYGLDEREIEFIETHVKEMK